MDRGSLGGKLRSDSALCIDIYAVCLILRYLTYLKKTVFISVNYLIRSLEEPKKPLQIVTNQNTRVGQFE